MNINDSSVGIFYRLISPQVHITRLSHLGSVSSGQEVFDKGGVGAQMYPCYADVQEPGGLMSFSRL